MRMIGELRKVLKRLTYRVGRHAGVRSLVRGLSAELAPY